MTPAEKIKILFEDLYADIVIAKVLYEEKLLQDKQTVIETLKFIEANNIEKKISEASTKFAQGKFNETKLLKILEEARERFDKEIL